MGCSRPPAREWGGRGRNPSPHAKNAGHPTPPPFGGRWGSVGLRHRPQKCSHEGAVGAPSPNGTQGKPSSPVGQPPLGLQRPSLRPQRFRPRSFPHMLCWPGVLGIPVQRTSGGPCSGARPSPHHANPLTSPPPPRAFPMGLRWPEGSLPVALLACPKRAERPSAASSKDQGPALPLLALALTLILT